MMEIDYYGTKLVWTRTLIEAFNKSKKNKDGMPDARTQAGQLFYDIAFQEDQNATRIAALIGCEC